MPYSCAHSHACSVTYTDTLQVKYLLVAKNGVEMLCFCFARSLHFVMLMKRKYQKDSTLTKNLRLVTSTLAFFTVIWKCSGKCDRCF